MKANDSWRTDRNYTPLRGTQVKRFHIVKCFRDNARKGQYSAASQNLVPFFV